MLSFHFVELGEEIVGRAFNGMKSRVLSNALTENEARTLFEPL
jgi:hypothetical protein